MSRSLFLASLMVLSAAAAIAAPPSSKAPSATPPRAAAPAAAVESVLPPESEIQRIVDDRVVTYHDSVGLIVGTIEPSGRKLFARGPAQVGNDDTVDGETIFEIGSVTKLFTALLLADMAHRGELSLDDPVTKYLPAGTKLPERGGHPITLLDLATHMSGLPKMATNVAVTDFDNPNAGLTADQLFKSLQSYQPTRDSGAGYEYSNIGYQVLGLALTDRAGTDYETLLRSRVLAPLHMDNTRVTPSLAEKDRLAVGYDEHLRPAARSPQPVLPGSDGARSTANDLLDFLAANLGLTSSPLAPALAEMVKPLRPTRFAELKAALGWHVATLHGVDIIWLSGQTAGFRAFVGFAPKSRAGVVVLSNAANTIDDIGVHLLDPNSKLRSLHREVKVDANLFDNYVGAYQVSDSFSLVVTHDRDRLFIQGAGQPRAELFAENDRKFFLRVVDGEVTFQTDGSGRARGLMLTQDGKTVSANLLQ